MAIESIGTDKNINKITADKGVVLSPGVNINTAGDKANAVPSANVVLEKDGTSLHSSKGNIPAAGFSLGGADDTPAFIKDAEAAVHQYSSDKDELIKLSDALESFDPNKEFGGLSDDNLNELLNLGFNISMEHGKLSITDKNGNEIKLDDFVNMQSSLKNTLKRAIANTGNVAASANVGNVSGIKGATAKPLSAEKQDEIVKAFETSHNADVINHDKIVPLMEQVKVAQQKYEASFAKAQAQCDKVDRSVSQIISLKQQADSIIGNSKNGQITDEQKKQLLSLAQTIELKQKELKSNQDGAKQLMQDADAAYDMYSPGMSDSEKATNDDLRTGLKARISGQDLSVQQYGTLAISEYIYQAASKMSPEEVNAAMTDSSVRMKMLSPLNKVLDKVSSATKLSDLSSQDIKMLWTTFRIKAVDDNGKLSLLYYPNNASSPTVVTKDDIRHLKTNLNNIVNSNDLFKMALAAGEVSLGYHKDDTSAPPSGDLTNNTDKKADVKKEVNDDTSAKSSISGSNTFSMDDEIKTKNHKWAEQSYLDKSFEERRDEAKYHEKQISGIHEKRHEINRELEKKRVAEDLGEA